MSLQKVKKRLTEYIQVYYMHLSQMKEQQCHGGGSSRSTTQLGGEVGEKTTAGKEELSLGSEGFQGRCRGKDSIH